MSERQSAETVRLLREAFMAGWDESGEGYNAEYPHQPEKLERVQRQLDQAFAQWLATHIDGLGEAE